MSDKKLEVLESRVLEAAKDCPTVKAALAKIFPETFKPKEEWEDVTTRGAGVPGCNKELPYYEIDGKCFAILMAFEANYNGYTYKIADGRIWRKKA